MPFDSKACANCTLEIRCCCRWGRTCFTGPESRGH